MTRDRLLRLLEPILSPLAALAVSLAAASVILWAMGFNPWFTALHAVRQCLGNGFGLGSVLHKTTQLIFPAVAVAFALRAGLFNIGAEGQLFVASFAVAVAALGMAEWPAWIALPALFAVAALAGALWGALPGVLKAWRGAHEVISTIMLNWIAFAGIRMFFRPGSPIIIPGTVQTKPVADHLRLETFDALGVGFFAGSRFNLSVLLAIALLVFYAWLMERTRTGLAFRAVGLNPHAARAAGISVPRRVAVAMMISGAFAGLVGLDSVLGERGSFGEDSASGLGFTAIAVALLGRCRAVGIAIAAFFFGFLGQASIVLKMRQVPREIIDIIQAFVILAVVSTPYVASRLRMRAAARAAARAEAAATPSTSDG